MRRAMCVAALVVLTPACGSPTSATPTTGLIGTVVRTPVAPVCSATVSCSAPFSAAFTVDRSGAAVSHFVSDTDGHFTVMLSPGTYQIVPDASAPLIAPTSQVKMVTVRDTGLTTVTLEFDTGIR